MSYQKFTPSVSEEVRIGTHGFMTPKYSQVSGPMIKGVSREELSNIFVTQTPLFLSSCVRSCSSFSKRTAELGLSLLVLLPYE